MDDPVSEASLTENDDAVSDASLMESEGVDPKASLMKAAVSTVLLDARREMLGRGFSAMATEVLRSMLERGMKTGKQIQEP